jgi:hypothetical protein
MPIYEYHCIGWSSYTQKLKYVLIRKQDLPIGNMNDNETAMHDGKISLAGWIFAVFA